MRSAHSRHAFAALDNLIDKHYIIDMREQEKEMANKSIPLAERLDEHAIKIGLIPVKKTVKKASKKKSIR